MQRYALRDDQWTKIKDFLPGREGHVGGTAPDNRLFVDAVVYRYRTGIPWRDLPPYYGHWKATHRRFRRWCESGVFARILGALALDADAEFMSIDSTSVRAHQHSTGAQKKTARIKPSADRAAGDDQDPRYRRCARQPGCVVTDAGASRRHYPGGAAARPGRTGRLPCRQGLRQRCLDCNARSARYRAGHPAQGQPAGTAQDLLYPVSRA